MDAVMTQHIVMTPGVCGGKPRIDGTRIRVMDVVGYHLREGYPVSWLVENLPGLTEASVHAALAFYYDNTELVDAGGRADDERIEALRLAHGDSPA